MTSPKGRHDPQGPTDRAQPPTVAETPELGTPFSIASRKPGRIFHAVERIERLIPAVIKRRIGFLLSFKNRILFSTALVLMGVVVIVGIMLQIVVFPKLKGESAVITNIKVIHFLTSLVAMGMGWIFIEFISKKIAKPLIELTERADQISREAGARLGSDSDSGPPGKPTDAGGEGGEAAARDEIQQLTSSFNRMLAHLKASEGRLRESEEKYRFLFDSGPSAKFVFDAETMMILDANERAEAEYRFTREEFLRMSFADLGLDQDREQTSNALKQIFPTEVTLLPILQHRRQDGSLFMVNFQARLTRYGGRPAIIAAVWDVTERLEKHAKLIQAGKMATLGEMATGIAHELNQPLNVIMLGCDYLANKVKGGKPVTGDELQQVATELTGSVERASRIINHLRQFGRRAEPTRSPVEVNAPIQNVLTLLGTQLEAKGIRWELDLDKKIPKILGDANRLEQVLINLILNARDAMLSPDDAAPGTPQASPMFVKIRSFLDGDRVVVTVADTGPGIPDAIKSKVFEPFFTTKIVTEGTGLGLSISYGIIKEHQGTIEIDGRYTDGAMFRLTFPVLPNGEDV